MGQPVRVKTHQQLEKSPCKSGTVRGVRGPRPYEVEVDGAVYKRNRVHLRDWFNPPQQVTAVGPQEPRQEFNTPGSVTVPAVNTVESATEETTKTKPTTSKQQNVPAVKPVTTRRGRVSRANPK